jgi:hypothetical protein
MHAKFKEITSTIDGIQYYTIYKYSPTTSLNRTVHCAAAAAAAAVAVAPVAALEE